MVKIQIVNEKDVDALYEMIKKTIVKLWPSVYPERSIKYVLTEDITLASLSQSMQEGHFYVAIENNKIVGCGCVCKNKDTESECTLRTIFVNPNYQGKGIGKSIMHTLESDEIARQSIRIEVPSSLHAISFYKKYGYEHKDGRLTYKDGCFILEKHLQR